MTAEIPRRQFDAYNDAIALTTAALDSDDTTRRYIEREADRIIAEGRARDVILTLALFATLLADRNGDARRTIQTTALALRKIIEGPPR